MKIKKISQPLNVEGAVIDSLESNSVTNAPSIKAVNEAINNASKRSIMTSYLEYDETIYNSSTSASYNYVSLTGNIVVGDKLGVGGIEDPSAATTSGSLIIQGIKVGSGASKVLVNAKAYISNEEETAQRYILYVYKNTSVVGRAGITIEAGKAGTPVIPPLLVSCEEDDVFVLRMYTLAGGSAKLLSGAEDTALTVEVVE